MYQTLVEEAGLTHNEAAAYLALLKIGKSKTGEIVKEAKISGGKVYETLYKLVDKGLVKQSTENGVKYFNANDPDALLALMHERAEQIKLKEEKLKEALPQLRSIQKLGKPDEGVTLIRGLRGIGAEINKLLETATVIEIMGVTSSKNLRYNNFWKNWHRERVKLKKKARIIFSDSGTAYWKHFSTQKYTEVKSLSTVTPSAVMIVDNHVFVFDYGEEITCVHMLSEKIALSFREFFNSLWRIGNTK